MHAQCHIPAQICLISCLKEYENLAVYYKETDFLLNLRRQVKPSCSNRHLVDTKRIHRMPEIRMIEIKHAFVTSY